MNGAADCAKQTDEALDRFEIEAAGMPSSSSLGMVNESARLLAISPEEAAKMPAEERIQASLMLRLYSFHLQRLANRELSRARYAEECVKKTIRSQIGSQKGASYEERRMNAIAGNDAAQKYEQLRVAAQLRCDRLAFMSNKAMDVARGFSRD